MPETPHAVLTHHWLVRMRGGEKVLAALAKLVPGAPIYTVVHDRRGFSADAFAGHTIHTSWLQALPGARRHYARLLPLLPHAARSLRLPEADVVICSDAAIAKAMTPHRRSRVICYCHSPMRYVYEPEISQQYQETLPRPLRRFWPGVVARARAADEAAAERVDRFIANSQHVAARIQRAYGRESDVVYPPVELPDAPSTAPREPFYLCVGYHTRYKRLDLAIEACRMLGRKLVVIGDGPEVSPLRAAVERGPLREGFAVEWRGWLEPEQIADYYRRAAALLFPGEEDFGIVPVEAMGHGCPVIAYGVGGAAESVIDGETGVMFQEATAESLAGAMQRADGLRFDPAAMHARMQRFSYARFEREMRGILFP